MKFRAVIQEEQCMKEFLGIVVTLSKLSKNCVINISRDKILFLVNEESSNTSPMVWIEISAPEYFTELVLEGVSAQCNNILLWINTSNFARALSGLRSSVKNFKIKLTKIQFPCLTIEMDVYSNCSEISRQVVHDVPVDIIPRSEWSSHTFPKINPKLVLNIPWNRIMRGLIEKIKNLSPSIVFFLTSNGEMNLIAETELSTTTTRLKNLNVIECKGQSENSNQHVELSCSVDSKKAFIFLSSLHVPHMNILCGILDDQLIHIKVDVSKGVIINTILPAVSV